VTAVDGPGTRMTVFLNGCPLRCLYCHNPDTFLMKDGAPISDEELLGRIARYRRIFRATNGGITLSGGEVLMQPAFAKRIIHGAKQMGVHTCIDTSGYLGANCDDQMLDELDLVLLDVKSGNEETYKAATGRELAPTIAFGDRIAQRGGPTRVWIRFVLVPGLTDGPPAGPRAPSPPYPGAPGSLARHTQRHLPSTIPSLSPVFTPPWPPPPSPSPSG